MACTSPQPSSSLGTLKSRLADRSELLHQRKQEWHNVHSCVLQPCRGTFFVQYEVREELGEGAFGKVVKVRRRRDGRMFVAKIMHDRGMTDKARAEVTHSFYICACYLSLVCTDQLHHGI